MYSINSILPERVGVGEAPNSHYLIYFIQHHILKQQRTRKRLVGSAKKQAACFSTNIKTA
jgi:hypothetical protein